MKLLLVAVMFVNVLDLGEYHLALWNILTVLSVFGMILASVVVILVFCALRIPIFVC